MTRHSITALLLLAAGAACGPPQPVATPGPDRVTAVFPDGTVWRQTTSDENSDFTVAASPGALWGALTASYSALGIPPTLNDRPGLRYGNAGFVMPPRLADRRLAEYFDCGQGPAGARVETGRVVASATSAIVAVEGETGRLRVTTRVTGTWRSNDGTSNAPVTCASTGLLETSLRAGVEQRLSPSR